MYFDNKIFIGKSNDEKVYLYPGKANRHGLIAGATGTGKTVTLKVLAESFSAAGVPVFLADIKGDLAGMCECGVENDNLRGRVEKFGLNECGWTYQSFPTEFWDIYEEKGLPLRTTVTEMGPLILAQVLGLNEVQTDILTVVFKIADDNGLLLIDTKDLKAMLQYVGENAKEFELDYGNIARQSVSAIVRAIVALESEGGDKFFGEPALSIGDWFTRDASGKGTIQVLDCQKLIHNPTMYASFMLWLMSELFETLPEVGDPALPKMIFFFDEAHLLFKNASKELLNKVDQVVKLIRSKGVGIYFITQNPKDIPDGILSQLGNKIQHGLNAYTPAEQKAARAAADSFRENPEFDTFDTLITLGTGEALVSVLDEKGVPTIVKKTKILPPQSLMGAIEDEPRMNVVNNSFIYPRYKNYFDRDSAYEFLTRRSRQLEDEVAAAKAEKERLAAEEKAEKERLKAEEKAEKERIKAEEKAEKERIKAEEKALREAEKEAAAKQKQIKKATKNLANSAAGTIGRELGNTLGKTLGGTFGKKVGGNVGATLARGILGTLFNL